MRSRLHRLWEGWKRVGRKFGDFQARLILTLFYFVILAPFALLVRVLDPLNLKGRVKGWVAKSDSEGTAAERATRQF